MIKSSTHIPLSHAPMHRNLYLGLPASSPVAPAKLGTMGFSVPFPKNPAGFLLIVLISSPTCDFSPIKVMSLLISIPPGTTMASSSFPSSCFLITCLAFLSIAHPFASADSFQQEFVVTWGFDHVTTSSDGRALWLMLDNSSGSSFASKKSYLFGSVSMQMKLVPGDSAGVVTAYYMASPDPSVRDELDFEFLGNRSGEPYLLQTNVFAHGIGGREQRIYLWFDPTEDFHAYSFLWNQDQIMFLVDDVPIRVFLNSEKQGVAYPNSQAMGVFSSIWNGDQWATEGGMIKTNWSHAPFITSYQSFNADACEWTGGGRPSCALPGADNWWNKPPYTTLSPRQVEYLQWVKQNYMVYDYCTDSSRYQPAPKECSINP